MNRKKFWSSKRGEGEAFRWLRDRVDYSGDDCLIWPFAILKHVGRGYLGYNGKSYYAHRLMCILVHGEPPTPKHQAAHSCGNGHKGCVNPRHLQWQTHSENQRDRRKHGTHVTTRYGSRSPLTVAQVREIRSVRGIEPQLATAARFGISLSSVQRWQKKTTDPAPPGTSRATIARREKRQSLSRG